MEITRHNVLRVLGLLLYWVTLGLMVVYAFGDIASVLTERPLSLEDLKVFKTIALMLLAHSAGKLAGAEKQRQDDVAGPFN